MRLAGIDQPMRQQGPDHAVDVHATHPGNPAAGDRLQVGDDGQGLQGGLAQPGPGLGNHGGLQRLREVGGGGQPPSPSDTAQFKTPAGVLVEPGQLL